jgi:hypothetical protein
MIWPVAELIPIPVISSGSPSGNSRGIDIDLQGEGIEVRY